MRGILHVNLYRLDHRGKGFLEIKTLNLVKPFCYKSSLVFQNGSIKVFLDPKDPFSPNGPFARRKGS